MSTEPTSRIVDLFYWLARPDAALKGALAAFVIWTVFGMTATSKQPAQVSIESSEVGAETIHVTWAHDYLGHFLLTGALAAGCMLWYTSAMIDAVNAGCRNETLANIRKLLSWAGPIVLAVCVTCVVMNARYVLRPDSPVQHWQSSSAWLPWLVAGNFYLLAMFPLVLSLLSHGTRLITAVKHCETLIGFDQSEERLGVGLLGDNAVMVYVAIMLFMLPPVLIQIYQKNDVTTMSYINIDFGILIVFFISIRPLVQLALRLSREKADVLDRLLTLRQQQQRQLDEAPPEHREQRFNELQATRSEIASAHQLKTFPIRWQAALGAVGGVSAIAASTLQIAGMMVGGG